MDLPKGYRMKRYASALEYGFHGQDAPVANHILNQYCRRGHWLQLFVDMKVREKS